LAEKQHNRRNFFKLAGLAFLFGAAVLWEKMFRSEKELASLKSVTIPFDINREFSFHEKFIVVNKDGNLRVFSSYCTHLGCQIHQAKNGKLLCPCHGSTFDLEGFPTRGPAIRPLEKLSYSVNELNQTLTINL